MMGADLWSSVLDWVAGMVVGGLVVYCKNPASRSFQLAEIKQLKAERNLLQSVVGTLNKDFYQLREKKMRIIDEISQLEKQK